MSPVREPPPRGLALRRQVWALLVSLGPALLMLGSDACGTANCSAICGDGTITFTLVTPLEGGDVAITVLPPSSAALSVDCQPADGPADCTPPSALSPHFTASGTLKSVELPILGTGQYRIQIAVDGVQVVDDTYDYNLARVTGACGSSCYPSATVEIQN
jgi:hypothetical protein